LAVRLRLPGTAAGPCRHCRPHPTPAWPTPSTAAHSCNSTWARESQSAAFGVCRVLLPHAACMPSGGLYLLHLCACVFKYRYLLYLLPHTVLVTPLLTHLQSVRKLAELLCYAC
jgi:hypothetical protein